MKSVVVEGVSAAVGGGAKELRGDSDEKEEK